MKVNKIDCISQTHTGRHESKEEFHAMFIQIDDFHSKFPQMLRRRHRWHENKYFILISLLCADKNQVLRGGR